MAIGVHEEARRGENGVVPLLGVPDDQARVVLAAARRRRYSRREVIFHEGDPAQSMHVIVSGQVALRVTTPLGDSATLDILGAGEMFGELALLPPAGTRSATAQALAATETIALGAEEFTALRKEEPAVATSLLATLVERNRKLNGRLVEALYVPVEIRLIRRLLDIADRFGGKGDTCEVMLSQDDLAGLAGTTRETTNRILSNLASQGLLQLGRGRIELLDAATLSRKAR
jgi:CRP-like cAMP-binding protein